MSDKLEPRFEILIEQLADQIQEALRGEATLTEADVAPVVGRLHEEGFDNRSARRPLWTLVEDRVVDKYPEPAIHRRAELQSLLGVIRDAWQGLGDLRDTSGRPR
ncbi:hypothetical protein [Candidatus Laterigemmans baculatus]|uniref:hypothetical protein n=1 Tax=Candidatus Laterigemmans baculatus TaxID=2770505 RepID=UPI0013DD4AFD|nr:hypothetical protein [Candidatus Laterigemmans baculatus]